MTGYYAKGTVAPTFDLTRTYRVALIPLQNSPYMGKKDLDKLYDVFSMELLRTGLFMVIERRDIEKVLDEQGFQYSGVVDESQVVEFGKILGAELIGIYNIETAGRDIQSMGTLYVIGLYFKLVNVKTGEVVYYSRGRGEAMLNKESALEMAVQNCLHALKKAKK
jgi:curli biogenesis system outer membrane secretion channel CsgG